jgi:hypothetical protein
MMRRVAVVTSHGEVVTEVAVAALTTEPELRDIGRSLIALTRYWDRKTQEGKPS